MAHPGTAHKYHNTLIAFEHSPPSPPPTTPTTAPNTLLWVGGLGDGLLTVRYPTTIAATLPPTWVLAEVLLSSSYKGWGTGSLQRDAAELDKCVAYFKALRPGTKVVVMGHSTGCQDIMEYVVGEGRAGRKGIDGAVLQGGVSDVEAWEDMVAGDKAQREDFDRIVGQARGMVEEGKGKEIMPMEGNFVAQALKAPMSAYRTYSLLVKGQDDDYFSSDLSEERLKNTFGKIPKSTPFMFLLGDKDPFVPASIDKATLIQRWTDVIRSGGGTVDDKNGGILPDAQHSLRDNTEEVRQDLANRVVRFLKEYVEEAPKL
ncbi:DUF1749-domain-containing protein [Corynespora cassiicola Philippines]|uniref:DUF1749-domain-containing protein n=1 Tax=Corynespora cassiicola Philippines TaxID=1448308 RepID=A0A2T2NK58_CORCC|nr:DUF1749-domain-containing protein [Corynespora cassiicola Philippines]